MTTKAKSTPVNKPATKSNPAKGNLERTTTSKTKTTAAAKPASNGKTTAVHSQPTKAKSTVKPKPATNNRATTGTSPSRHAATNIAQTASKIKAATPTKMATKKPAAKPAVATPKVVVESKLKKDQKDEWPKKIKMVRDSFSMPETDYSQFAILKRKCLLAGVPVKKSELLRAGLICLSKLTDSKLLNVVEQVEVLKTGRPAKNPPKE